MTRDEALRKYHQELRFHIVVNYLLKALQKGSWTAEEILAAAELAVFLEEDSRNIVPDTIANTAEGGRASYPGETLSKSKE